VYQLHIIQCSDISTSAFYTGLIHHAGGTVLLYRGPLLSGFNVLTNAADAADDRDVVVIVR